MNDKKELDERPTLGYDVKTVRDQDDIERKYEKILSKSPEDELFEAIFGAWDEESGSLLTEEEIE